MLLQKSMGLALAALLITTEAWADLRDYLRKPEADFEWRLEARSSAVSAGRIYDVQFVSQTWQKIPWRHQLQIYLPPDVATGSAMFLWITGGSARTDSIRLGMELARKMRAPVAFLYHVPNQPLLEENLYEDDLIAETFVRYLHTDDEHWPLLFPMVKSVVKAMDVLQAFGKNEWNTPIDKFIVGGASKRGWTAWLTGAVDQRVGAIAPVVIDVLNMREQMRRQLRTFGAYSSRLAPYSSRGLLPIPETPRGQRLLSMVDPWAYRDRLTMPKLIVNGTNDLYWATDALNLYWKGIPGDKWVLYVPNAGHSLRRQDRPQPDQLNHLIDALAAFSRHQISGRPMPNLAWKHESVDGKLRLTIQGTPAPLGARLWLARTPTRDFRGAKWRAEELKSNNGQFVGEATPAATGHLAMFGEVDYEIDGLRYHLSSQLRLTE
jgi:PhoPQ-activated pathogenicity-related protein